MGCSATYFWILSGDDSRFGFSEDFLFKSPFFAFGNGDGDVDGGGDGDDGGGDDGDSDAGGGGDGDDITCLLKPLKSLPHVLLLPAEQ